MQEMGPGLGLERERSRTKELRQVSDSRATSYHTSRFSALPTGSEVTRVELPFQSVQKSSCSLFSFSVLNRLHARLRIWVGPKQQVLIELLPSAGLRVGPKK